MASAALTFRWLQRTGTPVELQIYPDSQSQRIWSAYRISAYSLQVVQNCLSAT